MSGAENTEIRQFRTYSGRKNIFQTKDVLSELLV